MITSGVLIQTYVLLYGRFRDLLFTYLNLDLNSSLKDRSENMTMGVARNSLLTKLVSARFYSCSATCRVDLATLNFSVALQILNRGTSRFLGDASENDLRVVDASVPLPAKPLVKVKVAWIVKGVYDSEDCTDDANLYEDDSFSIFGMGRKRRNERSWAPR